MNAKVSGVRSVELGVRDLQQSADFYTKVWALEEMAARAILSICAAPAAGIIFLTIRQRRKPTL